MADSPYPVSKRPDTLYRITQSYVTANQWITVGTLQGLLAKTKPRIFRVTNSANQNWLDDLRDNYGVKVLLDYDQSFMSLIARFKSEIPGYVICNSNDNSLNVAISLCGVENAIAVTSENVSLLDYYKIPKLADVRGKDEYWFFDNYKDKINKRNLVFNDYSKMNNLSDMAVFGGMMTFWNTSFTDNTTKIFSSFKDNGGAVLYGWGFDEYQLVKQVSPYNLMVNCSDYANNLSTLCNFYTEVKQKEPVIDSNPPQSAHTVCFLMSDGDNVQWILNSMAADPKWYGSSNRGKTNIGWTIAPAVTELAPTTIKYLYDHAVVGASGNDNFVASPSGLGYVFPDALGNEAKFASMTNDYMKRADLRIVNIIGNDDSDQYMKPFMDQSQIDGILFYYYSNYAQGAGKIKFVDDKPVVHGKYNLWSGTYETPASLAAKLNAASKNIYSSSSYTLVPVHVWTNSVDDIVTCSKLLDSTVRVVTPTEFIALIKKNLAPRDSALTFATNDNSVEKNYLASSNKGTGVDASHRWTVTPDKLVYHFPIDQLVNLCGGQTDIKVDITVANEYVISASSNSDSAGTELYRWSKLGTQVHDASNKTTLSIGLTPYIKNGWKDLYLTIADGNKYDTYDASVYNVSVLVPKKVTSVNDKTKQTPVSFSLAQNYPNPFNPSTLISYSLNTSGRVKLEIFDVLGRHIKTLVNSDQNSGSYTVSWNGKNDKGAIMANGVYFYRLNNGQAAITKKMIINK